MTAALKLTAAVLILTVLYTLCKSWLPAWAPLIGIAGVLIVAALLAAAGLTDILDNLERLQSITGTEAYLCLFKSVGIILLTEYNRNLCKDAGLTSVGVCVEFGGRCLVLLAAWPIFSGVLALVEQLAS